jgi:hypothetical protein
MKQGESGGLTMDATGAENHCTILCIAPSAKQKDVLWVSTDDGQLQLTQDGGKSWTNLTSGLKGLPAGSWIPQVVPSVHNAGEAFVVANDYRRENLAPYLFHTQDFGKTWKRIADESKMEGYTLSVVQDLVEPKLLFCGTDQGLYFSIDYGTTWTLWTAGYPRVSTMDLAIQPREHDLVMGTFGRSAWVLDDIRPLRELAQKGTQILDKPIHAFTPPSAVWVANIQQASGARFPGNTTFVGENRPIGNALLTFSIKEAKKNEPKKEENKDPFGINDKSDIRRADAEKKEEKKEEKKKVETKKEEVKKVEKKEVEGKKGNAPFDTMKVTLEIVDANKQVVRTLKFKPKVGVNRVFWGLDRKGVSFPGRPERPDEDERGGLPVPLGTYTLRYVYGTDKDSTTITILPDPREQYNEANLKAHYDIANRIEKQVNSVSKAVKRLDESKKTIDLILADLKPEEGKKELDEPAKALKKQGQRVLDSLKVLRETFMGKQEQKGIQRSESHVMARIFACYGYLDLTTGMDAPSTTLQNITAYATKQYQEAIDKLNAFYEKDWVYFRKAVEEYKFSLFKEYKTIEKE